MVEEVAADSCKFGSSMDEEAAEKMDSKNESINLQSFVLKESREEQQILADPESISRSQKQGNISRYWCIFIMFAEEEYFEIKFYEKDAASDV